MLSPLIALLKRFDPDPDHKPRPFLFQSRFLTTKLPHQLVKIPKNVSTKTRKLSFIGRGVGAQWGP